MSLSPLTYTIKPGGSFTGTIQVPGDKSISHRAIMLSAISEGVTNISGFLRSGDCLATLAAFQAMGVQIESLNETELRVQGVGRLGLLPAAHTLDLGNSGTSIRLMTGLLAGQSFSSTLTGDESLRRRPMARILQPLNLMGAHIDAAADDKPPLTIDGNTELRGIEYELPLASAQVKSCLLLAGLYAHGETILVEPAPSRDHTERLLRAMGCNIVCKDNVVHLQPNHQLALKAGSITVPGDLSSAAFFIVGAAIANNSHLLLTNVGLNPTRSGVIDILQAMNADITILRPREVNGEPIADIEVKTSELRGIDIDPSLVPLAIDEFPILFIAAACAKGRTTLRGAHELRVKESDRLFAMAQGLAALGIKVAEYPDGIAIDGGQLQGGKIESFGDHRIAMAFAIAGLRANNTILIDNCANVSTSFPNFVELAQDAGLSITKGST